MPDATSATDPHGTTESYSADDQLSTEDKQELKRLHNLGIPVPGVEIKLVDFASHIVTLVSA